MMLKKYILISFIVLIFSACSPGKREPTVTIPPTPTERPTPTPPSFYTVTDAWQNAKSLDGTTIILRGKARFMEQMTLLLCCPNRCDCNKTRGSLALVSDPPTRINKKFSMIDYVDISELECHGDQCTTLCTPFEPWIGDAFEFSGKLVVTYSKDLPSQLNLTEIDFTASSRLVNGAWEPIATGVFTNTAPLAPTDEETCKKFNP